MIILRLVLTFAMVAAVVSPARSLSAAPPESMEQSLIFHAPFDGGPDAVKAKDPLIYTGETMERKSVQPGNHRTDVSIAKGVGRYGDALRFSDSLPQVLFYQGINAGYQKTNWSGTVSFWLKLNPDKDLKPG